MKRTAPNQRWARGIWSIATAVTLAACSGDKESGSAVIVTTTTQTTTTSEAELAATSEAPTTAPVTTASSVTVPSSVPTSAATPTAAPTTPPTPPLPTPPAVVGDPAVASVPIGEFDAPVGLAVRPGDTALYVVEQSGQIVRFDQESSTARTVAEVGDQIAYGGEQGLLGLAFSPDGAYAYLNFTDNGGDTVVAEYAVAPDGTFDVAGGRVLITVGQPYANHNGGGLAIGPDAMLYIALGDGGSGGDPERRASDPTSLLGKLLRIDPTPSGDTPYTIPSDNPFATGELGGVAGAPEVFSWGLRNPWKFGFDGPTGDLWIADVGQNEFEEIDRIAPADGRTAGWGADFGWSAFEGTERFNDDVADPGNTVFPVLTYRHGEDGCSVSGGAVYRGTAIAELSPAYVYSDYCSGKIWALDLAGNRNLTVLDGFENVTAVAAGPTGELYVLEISGTIHQLVPG